MRGSNGESSVRLVLPRPNSSITLLESEEEYNDKQGNDDDDDGYGVV